jgi:hypothetical protein
MKFTRLILSFAAVIFATLIMAVSLMSANSVVSYEGSLASQKRFYVGETILPDHVLYPLVAVADRALLWITPAQQKAALQIAYGRIRLDYAKALLMKNEPGMAQAALTKSQKYHSLAAEKVCQLEDNEVLIDFVIQALKENLTEVENIIPQLPPQQRSLPEQLQDHNRVLLQKLQKL